MALAGREMTGAEILVQYGTKFQSDKQQNENSLFGNNDMGVAVMRPVLPEVKEEWSDLFRLNLEKEAVGIYLSSHPLAMYGFELKYVANTPLADLAEENLKNMVGKSFVCGGIVTSVRNGLTKKQTPYLVAKVEGVSDACEFALFSHDYTNYSHYFTKDAYLCISGRIEKSQYNDRVNRNITKVEFLSEVLGSGRVRNITLQLDLSSVNSLMVDMLADTLTANKDRPAAPRPDAAPYVPVRFHVIDKEKNIDLHLASQTYSVELSPKILRMVERTEGVSMLVNE